jgi:putative transposase
VRIHRGRKDERKSLSEADYAALLTAAHHQLHAPLIVFWDNLNTHISAAMRKFIAAHTDWLTVVRLPAYAPELNPTEGVWANMKNGLGNLATHDIDHFATIVKKTGSNASNTDPTSSTASSPKTGLSLELEPP